MEVAIGLAAWAIGSFCSSLPANAHNTLLNHLCKGDQAPGLTNRLSSGAHIYSPGSTDFTLSTTRWSTLDVPNVTITVEPATANDVAETVKYANERGIPFIAVNSGHGAITTVGKVKNGIEIWMRSLNQIVIAEGGKTVTMGGGVLSVNVTEALWRAGKQTGTSLEIPV
jgi:FAD/FMN-containing dehydrogenase